ncbi:collagen-binding domain-containing protein [Streptomyces sp. NPDC001478]
MKHTSLVCTAAASAAACVLCLASALPSAADYSGNPLAGSNGFGIIVQDDATLGSAETEGSVAVGGNLTYGPGYNIALHTPGSFTAPGDASPTALLVGGRIDHAGSSPQGVLKVLNDGYVKVGDPTGSSVLDTDANGASVATQIVAANAAYNSTPRVEETGRQPAASVTDTTGLPDLDALFAQFRDRSDAIGTCGTNVVLLDAEGNPLPDQTGFPAGTSAHVALTEGRTNVLHLTGEQLDNLSELVFDTPPSESAPFVVDVDTTGSGGTYVWNVPNTAGTSGEQAPYMLWNFSDATDITMASGDSLEGTFYAPRAHLTDIDASNIEGTVVARQLTEGPLTEGGASAVDAGEIHEFPFEAAISCGEGPSPSPSPSPSSSTGEPNPSPSPSEPTPSPSEPTPTPTPSPSEPTPTMSAPEPTPSAHTALPTPSPSEPTPTPSPGEPTPTASAPEPTPSAHTALPSHSSPQWPGGGGGGHRPPGGDGGGPHHRPPGGGLADTGTTTTLYAAAGALLLVAAGVFLSGRRRRPRH